MFDPHVVTEEASTANPQVCRSTSLQCLRYIERTASYASATVRTAWRSAAVRAARFAGAEAGLRAGSIAHALRE